jgi:phage gpG-like protein
MTVPKIEVDDRAVVEALNRLISIGEDPHAALSAVGRVLKARIQDGFITGTSPDGRPWAPLKSRAGQPLVNRGRLRNSIDYRVEGNSVEVGTNLSYAPVHQFGAKIEAKAGGVLRFYVEGRPVFVKRVTIPARPMFPTEGLPEEWGIDAEQAIADVIRRRWER